ncbi:ABC-type dipeptide/oligopeptide/nickel transport system, permease component [Geosporobacter subterraneus DSM 17957]|uniref:ABC-type dipeptide/oligopeptide/nickel transport system, permease component n=1 Tax=Geosporobacter subterraneus DSM 17957 TaxID=1121919 RepID=A0A1M6J4D8_9FIRM|nr:hypothetical protein [Geosporobacter subterraneus]SHJ41533.1 ABC-type dipeptide/oligopeptide/nickel transport system, permease component [Geosporobacter subterraneus DSM 17957]
MKKVNLPLYIGSFILLMLIFVLMFPGLFTEVNPYATQTLKTWSQENGEFSLEAPPFPPSKNAPFGTDEMGRDLLSFIVHGTKITMTISLLVVLGRFMVALPIGMAAGFGSYLAKTTIEQFSIIFSALPALLIGVIVLKMNFFANLYREQSIIAFVVVLTFIDWAKLGKLIMERVQEILARPFIKGEIAIGKSRLQIAMESVVPHLAAELVVLFFMEIARALTMMMQFGIFGVFVGNMGFILDSEGGQITFMNISFEPEWASLLGSAKNYVRTAPWIIIFPGLAFFVSILGFNLLGEGLRRQLQERDSKLLFCLRKLFRLRSYRSILLQGKKLYPLRRKKGIILALFIALLVLLLLNPIPNPFRHVDAAHFSFDAKDQVLIGTSEAKERAEEIARAFEQMGLVPIGENGYIHTYITEELYVPVQTSFEIGVCGAGETAFRHEEDYSFDSFRNLDIRGTLYDASKEDLLYPLDFERFRGQFVLLDSQIYSRKARDFLIDRLIHQEGIKGVFCALAEGEELPYSGGKDHHEGAVVWITRETAKQMQKAHCQEIHLTLTSKKLESVGRNVLGMIPGKDKKVGEEAILIGFGYNYKDSNQQLGNQRLLFALEIARQLIERKDQMNRTVIFAFWDGTMTDAYNGLRAYCVKPLYNPERSVLYIDLTKLETGRSEAVSYSGRQAPVTRYFAFRFNHQLSEVLRKKKVQQREYPVDMHIEAKQDNYLDKIMYYEANIPTIILGLEAGRENGEKGVTLDQLGSLLLETINKNLY